METTITATELARNLSDILNRARYKGERFIIKRNGETVAAIEPPPKSGMTLRELVEFMRGHPPDDRFADDLEAVHLEIIEPLPKPPNGPPDRFQRTDWS